MIRGEVISELWSTVKVSSLDGRKLLVVRPQGTDAAHVPEVVAVDVVGAGVGDRVLIATGQAARFAIGRADAACEAAIVGVIDAAVDEDPVEEVPQPKKATGRSKKKSTRKAASRKKASTSGSRKKAADKATDDAPSDETLSLPGFEDADAIWADEDDA